MALQPIKPLELMKNEELTKFEFNDFIGVWENFVPRYLCEKVINEFEKLSSTSSIVMMSGEQQFKQSKLGRDDRSLLLNAADVEVATSINQYLQACSLHYIDRYSQLKSLKLFSSDIKMQKTEPEGGYHVWHYESQSYHHCNRELVWAIYLNDLPEGEGETEFLHQRRRIRPTQGTVVIWPAGMTHVLKGNTVFTQDKYILTGWYLQIP